MSNDAAPMGEKLQKVLARAGLGSRREMERAIEAGRVTVNGEVAGLGERVTEDDQIELDGKRLPGSEENRLRVILYNKPIGEICSRHDPEGRPTVYDRLPRLKSGRWISVGRLDFNTSGLLLFTNSGELANKLMHPSSVIDREYLVRIQGQVDDEMKKRLTKGVLLDDGQARFTDIVESGGEGTNRWFYCGDGRPQPRSTSSVGISGRACQPPKARALWQRVYSLSCARRPVGRNGAKRDRRPVYYRGIAEAWAAPADPGRERDSATPAPQAA